MALTLRNTVGRKLTWTELDNNQSGLSNGTNWAATIVAPTTSLTFGGSASISSGGINPLDLKTSGGTQLRVQHAANAVNRTETVGAATGAGVGCYATGSDTDIAYNTSSKGAGWLTFYNDAFARVAFQMQRVANSVNYVQSAPQATSAAPGLAVVGSDTDIAFNISTKGAGNLSIQSDSYSLLMARFNRVASAVNFLNFSPSATLAGTFVGNSGTDANVSQVIGSKGANPIILAAGNVTQAQVLAIASAVNSVGIYGGAAGATVNLDARGNDANVSLTKATKGTGHLIATTNSGLVMRLRGDLASQVNWVDLFGGQAGSPPQFRMEGSDSNINVRMQSKGTGTVELDCAQGARILANFTDIGGSTVNFMTFQNNLTGQPPAMIATGTDTNVPLTISTKGTSSGTIYTGNGARPVMSFADSASSVNWWQAQPSSTGIAVFAGAAPGSSDTNVQILLYSKGTAAQLFRTGGSSGPTQLIVSNVTSAVNNMQIQGSITTDYPVIYQQGTDTNIGIIYNTKGTGSHQLRTGNSGTNIQLLVGHVANAVNYIQTIGAVTGGTVQISGEGTDSNVAIRILSKGSGNIELNPQSGDIKWNKALVALGGGAAPTLGTIGGSGPATAGQNSWLRLLDSTGAACWVPVWK